MRGQVLMVTAVVISLFFVTIIGFGYVTQSSTSQAATGPTDFTSESDRVVQLADYSMTTAIQSVNHDETLGSQTARETAVRETLTASVSGLSADGKFRGYDVDVELVEYNGEKTVAGTRVTQNQNSVLNGTDSAGNPVSNWTAVSGAKQTSQAVFSLESDELATAGDQNPFTLKLSNSSTSQNVSVFQNGADIVLEHDDGQCSIEAPSEVTVDFISGTVNGMSCSGYDVPSTIETIAIANGHNASGTYTIVGLGEPSAIAGSEVGVTSTAPSSSSADTPTGHHVVYAVPVKLTIATDHTTTTRLVIVAPGKPVNPLPT